MCIYIYIYGYMCVGFYWFLDCWPKNGSYLQHLWPASECLKGFLCLFWCKDHIKSCACVNLWNWKRTKDAGQVRSKTPVVESYTLHSNGSQTLDAMLVSWLKTWGQLIEAWMLRQAVKKKDTESEVTNGTSNCEIWPEMKNYKVINLANLNCTMT